MQFQRLYIDSRDRVSGTAESFEFQLSTNVTVAEESIAVLDSVLIPNSWYTITKNLNDGIYIREDSAGVGSYRAAILGPGYYDVNSLAIEIARALTQDSVVASPYTCVYNTTLGRYEISNPWTGAEETLYIWTEEGIDATDWGLSRSQLKGAFRQIGMVKGPTVYGGVQYGTDPLVMNAVPILQNHTQLFIKGSLGIPGLVQGPRGAQDILRRCVITAPQLGLNYDAAATHYDNIRIAPGTYSTMRFSLEGYYGDTVDLQGQEWSFSIVIFPRD